MVIRVDIFFGCGLVFPRKIFACYHSSRHGSTNIRDMSFEFDAATGNLTSRSGMFGSQTETFGYDDLHRLTSVSGGSEMTMNYSPSGNIIYKTGLGEYTYGEHGAGQHAVTRVASYTGSALQQNVVFNDINRPGTISQGGYFLNITYGADRQRVKSTLKRYGTPVRTIIYAGNYERITNHETGVTREFVFLPGGVIHMRQGNQNIIYYTHTDHLGSIIRITDGNGATVFAATYDAWGMKTVTTNTIGFHRGYTGHEHLPEFGLINMNARLYDPILGRFLSPDPFVADPLFSQDYNRYMYARNNPLLYTDPTGEFPWLIVGIGVAIGMWRGGAIANDGKANPLKWDWNSGKTWGYMLGGGIIGGVSAYAGASLYAWGMTAASSVGLGGFQAGFHAGMISGGASIGINSLGMNLLSGMNFRDAVGLAGIDMWKGGFSSGIGSGVSEGIRAFRDGRTFWTGERIETITWDIPNVGSQRLNDCVPTSFAEANDFFGGNISYEEFLSLSGYIDNVGVRLANDPNAYRNFVSEHFNTRPLGAPALGRPEIVRNIRDAGHLIHTNMPYGTIRHADNLRSIRYFPNGRIVLRYRIGRYRLSSVNNNWWFYTLSGAR